MFWRLRERKRRKKGGGEKRREKKKPEQEKRLTLDGFRGRFNGKEHFCSDDERSWQIFSSLSLPLSLSAPFFSPPPSSFFWPRSVKESRPRGYLAGMKKSRCRGKKKCEGRRGIVDQGGGAIRTNNDVVRVVVVYTALKQNSERRMQSKQHRS